MVRPLESANPGSFASGHGVYDPEMARLLEERAFKTVSMIRDPRDVVISHFLYVKREPTHFLHKFYMKMDSDVERLKFSVTGGAYRGTRIWDIRKRVQSVLRWGEREMNLTMAFEQLIGTKGGGSKTVQVAEIERLATRLGLSLSTAHIERISEGVFSQESHTFRKGEIGDWRSFFDECHRATFKTICGPLLTTLGYESDETW